MRKQPTREFGQADLIDAALGLTDFVGPKLASIIVFAGSIEYHLERAIWVLDGINPEGIRPATDGKQITGLIAMLEKHVASVTDKDARNLLEIWCEAARAGFTIRHNIAHGVSFAIDSTLVFSRNPRWHGEMRKREFGNLWCEPYVLDMIRESFATLLRIIVGVSRNDAPVSRIATPLSHQAAREARSILGEFADQCYNPNYEKY